MGRIEGILFDKDGTLFDFAASWSAWLAAMLQDLAGGDAWRMGDLGARLGFDVEARRFLPGSLCIAGTVAEQVAAILPALPGHDSATLTALLVERAKRAEMVPVVRLRASLVDLRGRGLVLGVATNDAEASARTHLARADIAEQFAYVAGFDSGHGAKPDPGMCRAFAADCGLDPERVVMVGDSTHDLLAGRTAGMRVVGVLTGMARREELAPHADTVLPDLSHLPAWLDGIHTATRQPTKAT